MHPEVQKLLEVQKVDQVLARVRRDLKGIPDEEARRLGKLEQLKKAAKDAADVRQEAELRARELELSIKQLDGEIEKLDSKLNTIKNNAEYQAILFQIESVKKDRGAIEEEALGIMENGDAQKELETSTAAAVLEEQKIFDAFAAEAKVTLAEREAELAKVSEGRADLLDGVTPDLRDEYERLFEMRGGQSVVAVEGLICQGCYTNITMNDRARLQAGSAVVQCGSCQRILYVSE